MHLRLILGLWPRGQILVILLVLKLLMHFGIIVIFPVFEVISVPHVSVLGCLKVDFSVEVSFGDKNRLLFPRRVIH